MKLSLYLEKYSTSKDDNKITYVMIPANHSKYQFPYNLEDRIKYNIKKIKDLIQRDFDYVVKKEKNGTFENLKNLPSYTIDVTSNKYIDDHKDEIIKMGFEQNKNHYIMVIN
jgi:hypothetical protein